MAKKDDILQSLLEHEVLKQKYNISKDELPTSLRDAHDSEIAIIKTIAVIINDKESLHSSTDRDLYKKINRYLNEVAI